MRRSRPWSGSTRVGVAVLVWLLGLATAAVGASVTSPGRLAHLSAAAQPESAAPAADPWGFEEDTEETWRDILAPQAFDLVMLTAFLALAMVSFVRRSVPLRIATLIFAVVYLGFGKSLLISVVNVFGLVGWEFPVFKYNLAWYLLAGFTVVSTILWGRLYCGRVCAFGALTQLMDWIVPRRWRVDVPARFEAKALWIKYGILASVLVYFVATKDMTIYRYVEPFWMFGLFASTGLWIGLGALLVATVFVRNLYCRFLCPLGAALGVLSYLTVFRIKRWSECGTCRICQKACEYGAIKGPKILVTECVRCDDCERIYADERKCPHWLIIAYKAGKRAASGFRLRAPGSGPRPVT